MRMGESQVLPRMNDRLIGRERPSDFGLLDHLDHFDHLDHLDPRFGWDHHEHMESAAKNRLLGAGRDLTNRRVDRKSLLPASMPKL